MIDHDACPLWLVCGKRVWQGSVGLRHELLAIPGYYGPRMWVC